MTEVISGGPPERPGADRGGPRRAATALTLAVLVAGGAWLTLQRDSSSPTHSTDAGSPTLPATPRPPAVRPLPLQPVLTGVSTAGPSGLRLLAGGGALTSVGAATGAAFPVVGVRVPPGGAVDQLLAVATGTLVVVQPDRSGGETGPGWVHLLRPGRSPVELLRADEVFSSAQPGRFWGFAYARQSSSTSRLVEATIGGRLLSNRPVPEGWQVHADTGNGLLVAVYHESAPSELIIVDPVSLRVRRSLGQMTFLAAATPRAAAWAICSGTCHLVVGDVRGGELRTFRLATNAGIGSAVFSPDERRLAIAYNGRHGFDRPGTPGFIEVLDLSTGRPTRVPGVGTPEKQAADLSWSSDGRWLGIAVRWPDEGYQRLGVWPAAGGRVVELPGRLPARYTSALLALPAENAAS